MNQNTTVGSLYGKNEDSPNFHRRVFQEIHEIGNEKMILIGDWNLILDPKLVYCNYQHVNNR